MEKKTHVACANAVVLYIVRPKCVSDLVVSTLFATLGGILPDVDLKDSVSDKLFDRLMSLLITVVIMTGLLKFLVGFDLYVMLKKLSDFLGIIISTSIFIFMSYLGSKTPHRSFTHSILGSLVYSFILFYGFNDLVVVSFFSSYVSHIILDLFNMRGVSIFYPVKFKFSFKLFDSSGKANKFLFLFFSFVCFLELVFISIFN